jgi:hypothetical protein
MIGVAAVAEVVIAVAALIDINALACKPDPRLEADVEDRARIPLPRRTVLALRLRAVEFTAVRDRPGKTGQRVGPGEPIGTAATRNANAAHPYSNVLSPPPASTIGSALS